jgi:hypothetical protein
MHPSTEFPFRCLLRLAGLRWRYSNLPQPQRSYYVIILKSLSSVLPLRYIISFYIISTVSKTIATWTGSSHVREYQDAMSRSLVQTYRHFEGTDYLHQLFPTHDPRATCGSRISLPWPTGYFEENNYLILQRDQIKNSFNKARGPLSYTAVFRICKMLSHSQGTLCI